MYSRNKCAHYVNKAEAQLTELQLYWLFFVCIHLKPKTKARGPKMLDLTQGAVGEKLNVVGQTELLHLHNRALVNRRVLNLRNTRQTRMKTKYHDCLLELELMWMWMWRCYLVAWDADASAGDLLHPLCVKVSEGKFPCRKRTVEAWSLKKLKKIIL